MADFVENRGGKNDSQRGNGGWKTGWKEGGFRGGQGWVLCEICEAVFVHCLHSEAGSFGRVHKVGKARVKNMPKMLTQSQKLDIVKPYQYI